MSAAAAVLPITHRAITFTRTGFVWQIKPFPLWLRAHTSCETSVMRSAAPLPAVNVR